MEIEWKDPCYQSSGWGGGQLLRKFSSKELEFKGSENGMSWQRRMLEGSYKLMNLV